MNIFIKIISTIVLVILMVGIILTIIREWTDHNQYMVTRLDGRPKIYRSDSWGDRFMWVVMGAVFWFICIAVIFGYIWT